MNTKVLAQVPAPLLEELTQGRWLPIVGAGFSKNAVVPGGAPPLDWSELGKALASDLPNVAFDNPLDAISSYEHAFGRVALVQRVTRLLRVHDAAPGLAHEAFAKLGFQRVITTNYDLLLERAYDLTGRPCLPLVDEFQLSGHNPYQGPTLLKLHGDVHHPQRMVLTEDDYDGFLRRHPLLATHLAAHMIENSAVLIGYSLDDPDMRQVLTLLKDRLGRLARPLWALQVEAPTHVVSRFERRGVHVINLKRTGGQDYGAVLAELFNALRTLWQRELIDESQSTDERTLADLRLPPEHSSTCYFAVPVDLVPWYRDTLFPVVVDVGLVPVVARDVLTPEGTVVAKIDALIARARAIVVDVSSAWSLQEAAIALAAKPQDAVLLVQPDSAPSSVGLQARHILRRPADLTSTADEFAEAFRRWLLYRLESDDRQEENEAERLLAAGEPRAALVAAVARLERQLAAVVDESTATRRPAGLTGLLRRAIEQGLLDSEAHEDLARALRLRNEALHLGRAVTRQEAVESLRVISSALNRVTQRLR